MGAVAQFEEGLELLAPADSDTRWRYALNAASALYNVGDVAGRNDALAASIDVYRRALTDAPRERVPLDWARSRNNLGTALWALGQRESGTAHLEEAVTAYCAALTVLIPTGADHYVERCRANKARVQMLLKERNLSD